MNTQAHNKEVSSTAYTKGTVNMDLPDGHVEDYGGKRESCRVLWASVCVTKYILFILYFAFFSSASNLSISRYPKIGSHEHALLLFLP